MWAKSSSEGEKKGWFGRGCKLCIKDGGKVRLAGMGGNGWRIVGFGGKNEVFEGVKNFGCTNVEDGRKSRKNLVQMSKMAEILM